MSHLSLKVSFISGDSHEWLLSSLGVALGTLALFPVSEAILDPGL